MIYFSLSTLFIQNSEITKNVFSLYFFQQQYLKEKEEAQKEKDRLEEQMEDIKVKVKSNLRRNMSKLIEDITEKKKEEELKPEPVKK